jgi:hypothetical protein
MDLNDKVVRQPSPLLDNGGLIRDDVTVADVHQAIKKFIAPMCYWARCDLHKRVGDQLGLDAAKDKRRLWQAAQRQHGSDGEVVAYLMPGSNEGWICEVVVMGETEQSQPVHPGYVRMQYLWTFKSLGNRREAELLLQRVCWLFGTLGGQWVWR